MTTEQDGAELAFKHEVREKREEVKEAHSWNVTVDGYSVLAHRDGDGHFELSICPERWDNGARLGLVKMHPKSLAELDALADAAPTLRKIAAGLRAALGTDDVRSRWDKMSDGMDAERDAMRKRIREEHGDGE